jgi:hypothetical protein
MQYGEVIDEHAIDPAILRLWPPLFRPERTASVCVRIGGLK